MKITHSIITLISGLFTFVAARSASGDRVLVVLEESADKSAYSQLWEDLESRHFKLTFESPKGDKLDLFKHGALGYDHLVLTPPKSKGYGQSLAPKTLLEFTNAGGNILLGLSSELNIPSAIASLLLEFDVSLPSDKSAVVVDHFNYDRTSASEQHDTLLLPRPGPLRPDVVDFFGGPGVLAVPHAVGQSLGNANPLLAPILRAPATAYIGSSKEEGEVEEQFATGSQIALISALQARNSARFTILGSLEMLQDKWYGASVKGADGKTVKTVNKEFARQITEWTFKEVGVLKVGNIEHHEVTDPASGAEQHQIGFQNPEIYRIKNYAQFSLDLGIWERTKFVPYTPPIGDAVQLEFSMLSPFHRLPLAIAGTTTNSTTYTATFKLPDQHGIFAFKVNYKRPFLTYLEEKRQVTVRHFAHDEWPRSWRISGGWPWITGLWSVIGGFLAFVVLWLYCEPPKGNKKT